MTSVAVYSYAHSVTYVADNTLKSFKDIIRLSGLDLDIVWQMQDCKCADYVFPSAKGRRPLSNMTLLAVLHRMGRRDVTVHGFRASFRSWAGHVKAEESDVLEAALAHVEKDETKKAYFRDDYYERRV